LIAEAEEAQRAVPTQEAVRRESVVVLGGRPEAR
tara:strand:+ start:305 stop:406 length:102 start_codon:yes stop_codon:yes gene_type:complete